MLVNAVKNSWLVGNRVKLQLEARASGTHWRSIGCHRFKEVPHDAVEFLDLDDVVDQLEYAHQAGWATNRGAFHAEGSS